MPSTEQRPEEVSEANQSKSREETEVEDKAIPLQAPRGYVILKPDSGDKINSELYANYRREYPQSGWVVSSNTINEDVEEGDFVCMEVESMDVAHSYYKVFEILLSDENGDYSVFCKPDVEPLFVETVEKARADGEPRKITLEDLSGEGWQFLTDDVLTYQWAKGNSPAFSLLYPTGVTIFEWKGEEFYKVREEVILAVLML